ncbi:Vacuolar protein sorting-associated protein 11 [Malassezia caprae]|uniref:Vacuolar protein sorting-associated protein 11 n=1 Tax=Malassezia caprae TaxID=1381934 RepID=A0AAF0E7Z8_9BASI|nr:Vacuolar protein sorting-associated protein 11 [Malassezia caprae]
MPPRDAASGAMPTWRAFSFFDTQALPSDGAPGFSRACTVAHMPSCAGAWASPRGALVVGADDGRVRVLEAGSYVETAAWQAFEYSVAHVKVDVDLCVIVAVGRDAAGSPSLLRVWRLEPASAAGWTPKLLVFVRLAHTRNDAPGRTGAPKAPMITALEVAPGLPWIAMGRDDGAVHVVRDMATLLKASHTETVQMRAKMVREPTQCEDGDAPDTVTGLVVCDGCSGTPLLIATVSRVLRFMLAGPGSGSAPTTIDTMGCAPHCAVRFRACEQDLSEQAATSLSTKMVLARDEALYVIGTDGRQASVALEGAKASMHSLHGELVVVFAAAARRVVVFDLDTKCITHSQEYADLQLVCSSDEHDSDARVWLVQRGGALALCEKPLLAKLEHLFRQHLYRQAVPFVYVAATRYPRARLPALPPTAAIVPLRPHERRTESPAEMLVADVYRRYGEHLYARGDYDGAIQQMVRTIGVVSPSFVIRLFLDAQRLPYLTHYLEVLHQRGRAQADHTTLLLNCYTKLRHMDALDAFVRADDVPFDVPLAIDVCRKAGCIAQAAYLAERHGMHDTYLSLQLRDTHDARAALAHLATLPPADATQFFAPYAHKLLDTEPDATCDLLVRLYTQVPTAAAPLAPLLPHFARHERALESFLERVLAQRATQPAAERAADLPLLYDTLLELHMKNAPPKALEILMSDAPYTPTHALMLCANYAYTEGLLCVYERLGMVDAILQHWMDASAQGTPGASQAVLDTLARHGPHSPRLYKTVLAFLTSSEALLEAHRTDMEHILAHIDAHALLSPMEVVQLLGRNSVAPMSLLTPYLLEHARRERAELESAEKLVASYRKEAAEKQAEIAALASETEPRVFQNPTCGLCAQALELPAVHFMCRHSFHLRCLAEGEAARECPLCAQAYATVQTLQGASAHVSRELVQGELEAADDSFDVIADLFAKGVLSDKEHW